MSLDATRAFLEAVKPERDAEQVAAAFGVQLAPIRSETLPAPAQGHWREVARLLKAQPDKPIPERAVVAIKSWPGARLGELIAQVEKLHEIFEKLENERLEDEIRDKIRRHYL